MTTNEVLTHLMSPKDAGPTTRPQRRIPNNKPLRQDSAIIPWRRTYFPRSLSVNLELGIPCYSKERKRPELSDVGF